MTARSIIEQVIQEISNTPPNAPFKAGDIIVPRRGKYPEDAFRVDTVTIDGVEAFPLGGGFGGKLKDPREFRVVTPDEIAQAGETLRPAKFYGDWFEDSDGAPTKFPGFTTGKTWNGWACPYFTKKVADQVMEKTNYAASLNMANDTRPAVYDPERDAYIFYSGTGADEEQEVYAAEMIGGKKLYPIGGGSWTWSKEGA